MGCKHRAVLIITRTVAGTASSLAKTRTEIACSEPAGHEGPHRDRDSGESWQDRGDEVTHILRHEDDEGPRR